LPFNDIEAVQQVMDEMGDQVACIIIEPVAGNMGLVPPGPGYLQALRDLTQKHGSLLIFDEVMTGFRVAYGGAQSLYNISPDLSCFGKVIGGGLPVGAYGGKHEIMSQIAPEGSVYQAGTLSGNPLAMAAGIATLEQLQQPDFYEDLEAKSSRLVAGLAEEANNAGIAARVDHVGSMIGMFFTEQEVNNFEDAKTCDLERFTAFYQGMREHGIYIAPSQFEALFLSAAHAVEHLDATVNAARQVFKSFSS
jgi:glutamate-1-semialdehyde 2,1-aminomutase